MIMSSIVFIISAIYIEKILKENKIQEKEFENIVEEDMNVRETSIKGVEKSSWYLDYSYFLEGGSPFFARGGLYWYGVGAGIFSFHRTVGVSRYDLGFRPVLV